MLSQDWFNGYFYSKNLILRSRIGKRVENQVADHLSRLEQQEETYSFIPINEYFPDNNILKVSKIHEIPWFDDFANFLASGIMPA